MAAPAALTIPISGGTKAPTSPYKSQIVVAGADQNQVLGGGGVSAVQAVAGTGTVAIDPSLGDICTVTPTGTTTFTISAPISCQVLTFKFLTSGTSSFTTTFGTGFLTTGTLASGTVDAKTFMVSFRCDGTTYIETARTTAM